MPGVKMAPFMQRRVHLMKSSIAPVALAFVVAVGSPAVAQDFESCAAESDDAARLACYDRVANSGRAAAAVTEEAERQMQAEAAADAATAAEAAAAMAAEKEAAAEAQAEAAARAAAEDEFGMNREIEQSRPPDANAQQELRELNMAVIEVRQRPGGEHIITLENGQVWVEKRAVYGFRVKVGDTVKLKKGVFGGYSMVGRGRRSSQVRRVE